MKSLILLALVITSSAAAASDWLNWRGPHGNGTADGSGYPTEWSAAKNIVWKFELPGRGTSTPVVAGESMFVTTTVDGKNTVICIGMDGKQRWSKTLGEFVEGKHKDGSGANPSAVTDGKYVFAYFKSGDLGCFTVGGELQWQKNLQSEYGEDTLWWDLGTSPVLTRDAVVIACIQSGSSYVAAFSKADGNVLWKQDRNLNAPEESAQSYSTPVVVGEGDHQIIVVLGADHVTAQSATDGKELWRVGGLNPSNERFFRSIASAVISNGIVVAPYARGGSLTAIKMDGKGDVTSTHVSWFNKDTSADVPTPAIFDGRVFVCRDSGEAQGTIDCLDLLTGKTIWTGVLPKNRNKYRSSPTVADGKLYITRLDGTVFVLDALGSEFKILAENSIAEEHTVASPVCIDGKIILRTDEHVYLIGK